MRRRFLIVSAAILLVAIVAMGATATSRQAKASATQVDLLAVDVNTSDGQNTPTTIGPVENCVTLADVGSTATVDVVIQGIPPTLSGAAAFDLLYNPAVIKITAFNGAIKYAGGFTAFSDPVPDTDGDFRAEIALFSDYVTGDGAVSRYTIEAVGNGVSPLTLGDAFEGGIPKVRDTGSVAYPITAIQGAQVVVGGSCTTPTPTPGPSGTETDLDAFLIERMPKRDYDAQPNMPQPGEAVTFYGHIRYWGDAYSPVQPTVQYAWKIDGQVVLGGALHGSEDRNLIHLDRRQRHWNIVLTPS